MMIILTTNERSTLIKEQQQQQQKEKKPQPRDYTAFELNSIDQRQAAAEAKKGDQRGSQRKRDQSRLLVINRGNYNIHWPMIILSRT